MVNCKFVFFKVVQDSVRIAPIKTTIVQHDVSLEVIPEIFSLVRLVTEDGEAYIGKVQSVNHHITCGGEFDRGKWNQSCEIFLRQIENDGETNSSSEEL